MSVIPELSKDFISQLEKAIILSHKEYLTIPEALIWFNISRPTLNSWFSLGLSTYRIQSKNYVRKSECEAFIEKNKI
ncbi:hypothetical protein GIY11_01550 [Aerococcaceae bacterium DSM 109653]|uniref:Helix-turn-helix domain-containing protein n=1 Tax=Fundicoccus ignavus TaxID=2664442 RepID=A0A844BKP7_9LACT|nr:helix-turn-helix domain-containing protein [Fundicoccus ignavus]MRI80718.1 hypothetical protein [Fundicoccus ignavus]